MEPFSRVQATGKSYYRPLEGLELKTPRIGHQRMVEEGFAWPGTLCVASDSHSNHYGTERSHHAPHKTIIVADD